MGGGGAIAVRNYGKIFWSITRLQLGDQQRIQRVGRTRATHKAKKRRKKLLRLGESNSEGKKELRGTFLVGVMAGNRNLEQKCQSQGKKREVKSRGTYRNLYARGETDLQNSTGSRYVISARMSRLVEARYAH